MIDEILRGCIMHARSVIEGQKQILCIQYHTVRRTPLHCRLPQDGGAVQSMQYSTVQYSQYCPMVLYYRIIFNIHYCLIKFWGETDACGSPNSTYHTVYTVL